MECKFCCFVLEDEKQMLKKEIIKMRNKLNKLIENGEAEEIIYQASKELDELILKYYNAQGEKRNLEKGT